MINESYIQIVTKKRIRVGENDYGQPKYEEVEVYEDILEGDMEPFSNQKVAQRYGLTPVSEVTNRFFTEPNDIIKNGVKVISKGVIFTIVENIEYEDSHTEVLLSRVSP